MPGAIIHIACANAQINTDVVGAIAQACPGAEVIPLGDAPHPDAQLILATADHLPGAIRSSRGRMPRPSVIGLASDRDTPADMIGIGADDVVCLGLGPQALGVRLAVHLARGRSAGQESAAAFDVSERLRTLYEAAPGPWLPVDDQIARVLSLTRRATAADVAIVFEIDDDTPGRARVTYADAPDGSRRHGDVVNIDALQWQAALEAQRATGSAGPMESPLRNRGDLEDRGLRWFMNLPLWANERPYGLLALAGNRSRRGKPVGEADWDFIRIAGRWLGTMLERVRSDRERVRLEERFRDAQKLETLGVVVGGIAHDFNNLLMTILANAKLARVDLPENSPVLESVTQLEAAARRAAELTEQMLAYAGKRRIDVSRVASSRMVSEMVPLLTSVISKNAELELELDDTVPEVDADAGQLRQIVMNLVTNASDALGGRAGTVRVRTGSHRFTAVPDGAFVARTAAAGDYIFVEVEDDGLGIAADRRDRIFDPFYTTKVEARGLGLAAVLGIVRAHRGVIHLRSEPGRGTCVRVLLPVTRDRTPDASGSSIPLVTDQPGVTVLVADDEEQLRTTLERLLVQFDFRVLTAADGREAVEIVREHAAELDVVLLDLTMPELGGEEALAAIRTIDPGLPILFMSGYHDRDGTELTEDDPLSEFVTKPFDPLRLIHRLGELARRRVPVSEF